MSRPTLQILPALAKLGTVTRGNDACGGARPACGLRSQRHRQVCLFHNHRAYCDCAKHSVIARIAIASRVTMFPPTFQILAPLANVGMVTLGENACGIGRPACAFVNGPPTFQILPALAKLGTATLVENACGIGRPACGLRSRKHRQVCLFHNRRAYRDDAKHSVIARIAIASRVTMSPRA
jgi:hypothetical protein